MAEAEFVALNKINTQRYAEGRCKDFNFAHNGENKNQVVPGIGFLKGMLAET